MGCDGGTIPKRDELVRQKKKPEQKDKDSERQFRWLHCALTQQRLQEPIVMCGLGRLYSKQNVIEFLLEKEKIPESAKHIKSLKDVKDLNLSPNPAYKDDDKKSEGLLDTRSAPYICKLIGLEMSGKFRFIGLWSCGCVFSERALKEINRTNICALCQTPFTQNDIVILNGTDEEIELMKIKMDERVTNRKLAKKDKLSKKIKQSTEIAETVSSASTSKEISNINETKQHKEIPAAETKTTNAIESEFKVNLNEPGIGRIPKNKLNMPIKRIGKLNSLDDPQMKKLKTDYSVAKDPKASDVYKSLFTSHKSEKEQSRAHWVTYNPFYN